MVRPRFDESISVMETFMVSEIRQFLRWANYNMTDALQVRCADFSCIRSRVSTVEILYYSGGGCLGSCLV